MQGLASQYFILRRRGAKVPGNVRRGWGKIPPPPKMSDSI